MAVFQAFNAAGVGFNMSSTGSSGWAFIGADPSVTTDLVYDNGAQLPRPCFCTEVQADTV
jgi:hypothetical protein